MRIDVVGTTARFTAEEYHRIAETGVLDERRVELIEGRSWR